MWEMNASEAERVIYTKDACKEPKETFWFRITKNTHKICTNVCVHLNGTYIMKRAK